MSIVGFILISIAGFLMGCCIRRLYRWHKRWRQRNWLVTPGDRITIMSSNGEETYTVKKVRKSTITLDDIGDRL